jgi:hypothetical protein
VTRFDLAQIANGYRHTTIGELAPLWKTWPFPNLCLTRHSKMPYLTGPVIAPLKVLKPADSCCCSRQLRYITEASKHV